MENPTAIAPMVVHYAPKADAALETAKMTASLPLVNTGEDYVGWMKPEVWAGMEKALREQGVLTHTLDVTQAYNSGRDSLRAATLSELLATAIEKQAALNAWVQAKQLEMVASYTKLLATRYQGRLDADADEFIGYVVDGATRMQQLINSLLAYSRIGTRGKQFVPVSCEAVLGQALQDLALSIEENGALVTHDPLPTVMADETQLTQLFQNLVSNAVRFHGQRPPTIHILMVEDNPGDVRLTKEALNGAKVRNRMAVVQDGVAALAFLRREGQYAQAPRPDLILLDLNLPKKDGREVLAEIKADEHLRRIPVVILTSSQAEQDIVRAYDLHANAYVTKPVDLEQFMSVVKAIKDFWIEIVKLPPDDE